MLNGIVLLWFALTALSVLFVAIDIRTTPESPVMKWAFVLVTFFIGPFGAFLYVLGCREPLEGLHERYSAVRWRQVLGSTMHCVAGDGLGILAGAVLGAFLHFGKAVDLGVEYALGFGFGWTIFQALFARTMAGSYRRALARTFLPELLSMNALMAGMVPVMTIAMSRSGGHDPRGALFWFIMSMSLLTGFILAYPINWWLVATGLKHGMMTVRPASQGHVVRPEPEPAQAAEHKIRPPASSIAMMTILSLFLLGTGITISFVLGGF